MHAGSRKTFHTIFLSLLGMFVFTLVVMFSWNSFAPDLFQMPVMKFKQAFGLVLFIGCTSFLLRFSGKHSLSTQNLLQRRGRKE
jgi:hypothetical protein